VTRCAPRNAFSAIRKTCGIVTCFYVDCLNTRLVFTRVHFADLLSSYPLGYSLGGRGDMGFTLLGVGEILAMEDLELPALFDKSKDGESIVGVRDPEGGRVHARGLLRG